MEKTELRKKDFITSIILIAFGIFMVLYAVTVIPMKDSWGGVMNVWFVSPGLFPVCIGILIIIMGIVLCHRAIKDGGAHKFLEDLSRRQKDSSGKTLRFLGILLVIVAYVYLYIPRIDYFLSTLLCLMVFISFFYLDDPGILKKLFTFYLAGCLFFLILSLAGIDKQLNKSFSYSTDILVFLFFLAYVIYCWTLARRDKVMRKKWRLSLIMSVVPSLILIPSFNYFLLVPLPVEGAFIELMNIVRYAFR
ncbi:MAG TPA: tripartite tricarboxylate transporter TctB family protein [Thermodesulfobacteriota bacterium]|nr:tripartite tricarboxylate transporter TctB family protein [Thermodesulfobacteriota bacterium]